VPAARSFLRRHARGRALTLDGEAARVVEAYPWPGNFRELYAALERGCLTATGDRLRAVDLGLPAAWPAVARLALERRRPLKKVARLYALWVLAEEGGNATRAAEVLGISRRTLIRWRRGES